MVKQEVKENLCYYDLRNPVIGYSKEDREDHIKEMKQQNIQCPCDNCFYGRHELLKYIK